ncbi:hypothetical protein CP533_5420 [Ophiocordyceps camponoti-saundersi (nom. inval.)]|nr:hypothetical protein CP533_5420 [Ophiocordyceps camponoti-saundersi (nom. inval.)]
MAPIDKLRPGIYVPTVAIFTPEDAVDVPSTKSHVRRLVKAGVAGIVVQGSTGEAVHLEREERKLITRATRDALDEADRSSLAIIAGCGAQSTRETIALCRDADDSGADFALVLPPSYYGAVLTKDLILEHFRTVAEQSPVPLLVYNFPAVCGGLDLDSDVIIALAKHSNIVGVKLTCGNTGKLARIVAGTDYDHFRVFGGSADFTVQTLSVGGHGVIAGLANVTPRACVEVMRLWKEGDVDEAVKLQGVVARGDWVVIKGGFVSVKAALETYYRYGGRPRRPCRLLEGEALQAQMAGLVEVVELERKLMSE